MGLIEAIPEAAILARADPDDANKDGISGRPNWVAGKAYVPASEPSGGPGLWLGRFGRKAQTPTLLQQTVEAYHQDTGVTSEFLPAENANPLASMPIEPVDHAADPEVPTATVQAVVHYLRSLAPPAAGADTPARSEGRALFASVGCAACHVPVYTTGPHRIAALSGQAVSLYSDLLLHDMGPALAGGVAHGEATGSEFRSAPLWGVGRSASYLHDGRAPTLEAAIVAHGGEATASRDRYLALSDFERAALVAFLESL
jgi:CxxC motif-containing protein (DUF1111 family)